MTRKRKGHRLVLTVGMVLLMLLGAGPVQARQEKHTFTLYPGSGFNDPYVLTYPITVGRPGEIRVFVSITNGKIKKGDIFSVAGVAIKNLDTGKVVASMFLKSKKKSFQLRYGVDSLDLQKGGRFEVLLVNRNSHNRLGGELLIDYPVAGEKPAQAIPLPSDLAVEGIILDAAGFVQVTVANRGKGAIAPIFWEKNGPQVILYRDGRRWGGAGLAVIDPGRELRRPGGMVVYHSRLKLGPGESVRAVLQPGTRFRDADPTNNQQEWKAGTASLPANRPDLAVSGLRLTGDCRVVVTVSNEGEGALPDSAWQKGSGPSLYLSRNGRGWGGADLSAIDPGRRLRNRGGQVRYTSNLRVSGRTMIRAALTVSGTMDANPGNNSLERQLSCR